MGGYYPVQLTFEEARKMMHDDPAHFKELVQESLRRQVAAINKLTARGMFFWDYGNSFLLEASRAGADILAKEGEKTYGVGGFRYPSYVQDIMGDIFSLGFGPFRWVCTSFLRAISTARRAFSFPDQARRATPLLTSQNNILSRRI